MPRTSILVPLLALTLVVSGIFLLFPQLDIGASGLFHRPGEGFPADRFAPLNVLRYGAWSLSWALVAIALVLFVLSLAGMRLPGRPGVFGYLLVLAALGPGLLVDVVLKRHFHRVRPEDLELFGGTGAFTRPYTIAGDCVTNCSFVSGEASGAAVAAIALMMFAALLPRPWATGLRLLAAAQLAFGAFLRVPMGGHFLSDVLLAILFMAILAELLAALMLRPQERWWHALRQPGGPAPR